MRELRCLGWVRTRSVTSRSGFWKARVVVGMTGDGPSLSVAEGSFSPTSELLSWAESRVGRVPVGAADDEAVDELWCGARIRHLRGIEFGEQMPQRSVETWVCHRMHCHSQLACRRVAGPGDNSSAVRDSERSSSSQCRPIRARSRPRLPLPIHSLS